MAEEGKSVECGFLVCSIMTIVVMLRKSKKSVLFSSDDESVCRYSRVTERDAVYDFVVVR